MENLHIYGKSMDCKENFLEKGNGMLKDRDSFIRISFEPNARFG